MVKKVVKRRKSRARAKPKAVTKPKVKEPGRTKPVIEKITEKLRKAVILAAKFGMVDSQLHWVARCSSSGFRTLLKADPAFAHSIKESRASALRLVGQALFQKATGLELNKRGELVKATELRVVGGNVVKLPVKPDTIAQIFFLKAQGCWRENTKVEMEIEHSGVVKRVIYSPLRREDLDRALEEAKGDYSFEETPDEDSED